MKQPFVRRSLCAAWFVAAILPAHADPSFECSVTSNSQVETANCLAETEDRVSQVLEVTFKIAVESATELDAVTGRDVVLPALNTSQAAWAAYRDAHCEHIGATYGGGSGTGIAIRACRVELMRVRINALLSLSK